MKIFFLPFFLWKKDNLLILRKIHWVMVISLHWWWNVVEGGGGGGGGDSVFSLGQTYLWTLSIKDGIGFFVGFLPLLWSFGVLEIDRDNLGCSSETFGLCKDSWSCVLWGLGSCPSRIPITPDSCTLSDTPVIQIRFSGVVSESGERCVIGAPRPPFSFDPLEKSLW